MALTTLAAGVALAALAAAAPPGTPPPEWSNYGPAERRFDAGFVMFAEYRDARWHAWIPSYWWSWTGPEQPSWQDGDPERGYALEFFSGEVVEAVFRRNEIGEAVAAFTGADGIEHVPSAFNGRPAMRSSPLLRDGRIGDLVFVDDWWRTPGPPDDCTSQVPLVQKLDRDGSAAWRLVLLRHFPATAACPHGTWYSEPRAALDLQDGTFLLSMEDRVVRLSFADLSPVGTGATLRVVDADVFMEVVSAQGDPNELLNKAFPTP